ncbi:WhiB family transcriptional regulator [Aestuariimicrobium soli]|uniref:WhiB family transcriptional regulator n=1 Tax=Aestuariimicrobium soli TaxID=2035834 RepID=UPI003EBCF9A7
MLSTTTLTATACATRTDLFQHPLLEDPGTCQGVEGRQQQQELQRAAEDLCRQCPLMTSCLYSAVVEHDVAGYVAGTTPRQRAEIRSRLGVKVKPEDLDTLAGVTTPNRQIDHDEVIRLRNANPYESLDSIARRLGCSLSTVKRHLRKARTEDAPVENPGLHAVAPSVEQVMHAYKVVTTRTTERKTDRRAA